MTPKQRYLFDVTGYLHLKNVLSPQKLKQAQDAADRYIRTPPEKWEPGFGANLERPDFTPYSHSFAFDKALETLCFHPVTWPIIKELTGDRPRFTSGTLGRNTRGQRFHPLHCAREGGGGPEMPRYFCQDEQIYCDFFVVFFYLTDVIPGDGGLVVIPGSHKSEFLRPPDLFAPDSDEIDPEPHPAVTNITPRAGDVVIISELLTHGVLVWKPKDRDRRFLILRYMPQYTTYGTFDPFPDEIKAKLSPETLELIEVAPYKHVKEIVKQETVSLTCF